MAWPGTVCPTRIRTAIPSRVPSEITPAFVSVGGVDAAHGYKVDWYFVGAESGYDVTLHVPGITSFTEHNQNNQCSSSSCGSLASGTGTGPTGQIGPQYLGTNTHLFSENVLTFSLQAQSGATDKGTLANGPGNPAPGQHPTPGNTMQSLVFSHLKLLGSTDPTAAGEESVLATYATRSLKTWRLVNGATADSEGGLWFLFAFNDTGGPDDNHDDFIGLGRVYEFLLPPPVQTPVPLPAGFVLMGTVLAAAGGIAKWRRRRKASA